MEHTHITTSHAIGPVTMAKCSLVPELLPGAKELLESQGCKIVRVRDTEGRSIVVNYPPGSIRQELFPRCMECRYIVLFPNGCELQETEDRDGHCKALYIVKTVFEALREKQLHG